MIDGPVEFMMGSPPSEAGRSNNEERHQQRIDRRFALSTKEVTQEQFRAFLAETQAGTQVDEDRNSPEAGGPVKRVSWYQAAQYCDWLSRREHLAPCYEPNSKGEYAEGMRIALDALVRNGYRLPTEAEWEYACRAGAVTSRHYGGAVELLGRYAWFYENSEGRAWPCGRAEPNELGLFDTLGNVYEWCQDQYSDYPGEEGVPPIADSMNFKLIREKEPRVLRGGSFEHRPALLRSADRFWSQASDRLVFFGLRLCRKATDR